MKLQNKLASYNAASKIVIILIFVLLLPYIVNYQARRQADIRLHDQRDEALHLIKTRGISYYLDLEDPLDTNYTTYTLLAEEYISLDLLRQAPREKKNLIETNLRGMEDGEIAEFRLLTYTFAWDGRWYELELGRRSDTIYEDTSYLQRFVLILLISMVLLTIASDIYFTKYLLSPLDIIVRTKLQNLNSPADFNFPRVKTTTSDFKHLDDSIHEMMKRIDLAFQKEREFISNASHELLTPISILQHKLENLNEHADATPELQVKFYEMQKTISRLKNIIKTLLLISRIENEQFLKEDTISLKTLLEEVIEEISYRLESKDITLEINLDEDYTCENCNKLLLFNMIFNLVNNAIKYNKEGGKLIINGLFTPEHYKLEFTDTGIGISPERLPYIFYRFKKINRSTGDSYGLGLPIVQTIANYHDIKIEVSSELDQGSTFRLLFPLLENSRSSHSGSKVLAGSKSY